MSVGSGLGGYFAVSPETTYGTYVAPSRAIEVTKVDLKKSKNTVQGTGIAAGRLVDRGARRAVTTSDASGSMTADVTANGFGLLIANLLGSTATPVQVGSTSAYTQTHVLSNPVGRSLTAQVGIPVLGGTLNPYSYLGCKVTGATFEAKVDEILNVEFDLDAQTVSETQSAITPAYANTDPFDWSMASVGVGAASGSTTVVQGVTGISLKVERGFANQRFYANGTGLKSEPILNAEDKITGTLSTDLVNKADFADRFRDDTPFALNISFTGLTIAGSSTQAAITFAMPLCYLDTDSPTLDGMDVVSTDYNFTALYDGTNSPITITYVSSDQTV